MADFLFSSAIFSNRDFSKDALPFSMKDKKNFRSKDMNIEAGSGCGYLQQPVCLSRKQYQYGLVLHRNPLLPYLVYQFEHQTFLQILLSHQFDFHVSPPSLDSHNQRHSARKKKHFVSENFNQKRRGVLLCQHDRPGHRTYHQSLYFRRSDFRVFLLFLDNPSRLHSTNFSTLDKISSVE